MNEHPLLKNATDVQVRAFVVDMTQRIEMNETTSDGYAKIERARNSPLRLACWVVLGCVIVLTIGTLGACLLVKDSDWRVAVGVPIAICGMGGYILKGLAKPVIEELVKQWRQ